MDKRTADILDNLEYKRYKREETIEHYTRKDKKNPDDENLDDIYP
jgi:hypothetical protein